MVTNADASARVAFKNYFYFSRFHRQLSKLRFSRAIGSWSHHGNGSETQSQPVATAGFSVCFLLMENFLLKLLEIFYVR